MNYTGVRSPFWEKGLRFSCTQCSKCCRIDPGFVFLSEQDLSALLKWSQISREHFIAVYCRYIRKSDGFEYLSLKEKANYDCIFWKDGCTVYKYRPFQCSSFPFWDYILSDKDCWDSEAEQCPGMNSGKLHSPKEIAALLEREKCEPIIRRTYQ